MKSFLFKLLLFLAPFTVFLVPLFGLIYCNEMLVNCREIAKKKEKYIFGLAYTEIGRQFKFINVKEKNKFEVVALGSSRVMQFRSEMFSKTFYNAGGVTQSITEYESFIRAITKGKLPEVLIIGLDQWMFNVEYQKGYAFERAPIDWANFRPINEDIVKKIKDFIKDYASGKIHRFVNATGYKTYGISARVESDGFRHDGSYMYTSIIKKIVSRDTSFHDFQYKTTLGRIKNGCCRFNFGSTIDKKAIDHLDRLLAFCKQNEIEVIAFLPPFATKVSYELMKSNNFKYMDEIYSSIKPLFNGYNYELYDFSNLKKGNEPNDAEMIDGYHGGEVTYVNMILEMLKANSKIKQVTNERKLESDLKNAQSRYIVYDY